MPLSTSTEARPFVGYVDTTADALRLIQAARCGVIPRITRRLNEMERRTMIRSGAVFVFSVDESGIKRWTDGYSWTPSRISGNFLVYREVVDRGNRPTCQTPDGRSDTSPRPENQMTLKTHGLVKKTITVKIDGSDHHLITYFSQEDIHSGRLRRPNAHPKILALDIPVSLVQSTNFRYPPKLEPGPDGRMTRIRDSDDSPELSESPSPTSSSKSFTQPNPSDVQRGHDGNTYSLDSLYAHSPRQREQYISPNQYIGDTYGSQYVRHPLPSSPTFRETTGIGIPVPRSSQWPSDHEFSVSPGSPNSPSPPFISWDRETQNVLVARGNVNSVADTAIGFASHEAWLPPHPRSTILPVASNLARPLGLSTLPAVQGLDDTRAGSSASSWEWDGTSAHPQPRLPPSQRSAQTVSSQCDSVSRYDVQRR